MKTLFLYLFPLLLMLGGALFGWLARWYKYGGRCGAGGLADGVPNVDAQSGTVRLDGSEPTVAIQERTAEVTESGRSALGSLKAGYSEGKATGTTPDSPADGSTVAKVGAVVGGAAAAVGAGIASASSSVRDATSSAADSAKSGLSSIKDGYSEGKAPGDTPDAPADGSIAAKVGAAVGGAVTTVKDTAASAVESTKSTVASLQDGSAKEKVEGAASDAVEGTKSGLAAMKDGYVEGKAPGDTPDAPADGSVVAKVGAAVGGAVSTVKETAVSAVESTKSSVSTMKDGYVEGKAPGETPKEPADGSITAKVGAAVGGAVATVKDTAANAVEGTKSSAAAMKDGYAEGKAPGETPKEPADGSITAKVGAAVGGAVTTVKDTAASAVESTKSSAAAMKDGYTEGRAPEKTSDTPADGSVTAKVGAAVGGAVTTAKDTAANAVESTKSTIASVKGDDADESASASGAKVGEGERFPEAHDPAVQGKMPTSAEGAAFYDASDTSDETSGSAGKTAAAMAGVVGAGAVAATANAATDTRTLPGATIGQEDGHTTEAEEVTSAGTVGTDITRSGEDDEAIRLMESDEELSRPSVALSSPDGSRTPDDLTKINGIGKATQRILNDEGIYYYDQIAKFGAQDVAWTDRKIDGEGRVVSDRWVPQAKDLAAHGSDGADTSAMRGRFAALSDEAEDDSAGGSGMAAGMLDIPDTLSDAEEEAKRLIDSGEEVGKPQNVLAKPEQGRAADDLKLISGIGPKIEGMLNDEGIYYFDQIADFGGRDLAWADQTLGFKGRVVRDRWVPQAKGLAAHRNRNSAAAQNVSWRSDGGASGDAPANSPLRIAEAEALRLIERDGGYAATAQNRPDSFMKDGPVGGKPDDLKRIKGIGEKLETVLNGMGVYFFRQIAAFSADDIAWLDSKLNFKGRIIRDRWVPQAEKFQKNSKA